MGVQPRGKGLMAYGGLPQARGELLLRGMTQASKRLEARARERVKGYEREYNEFILREI